jgi:hypothetical protein
VSNSDREPVRAKLRFLLGLGVTDMTIDLAIDAVLAWSIEGQLRVKQGQLPKLTNTLILDPSGSDPIPSGSLEAKSSKRYNTMSLPAGFQEFWGLFWRKVKKAKAVKAWSNIDPDPKLTQVIFAAVKAQRKEQLGREPKFRPHAASWLNGREWENEADPEPVNGNGHPQYQRLG